MSDKDVLELVKFFAAMFFVAVLGAALVFYITRQVRDVKDRVRCNIAIIFGTPVVLIVVSYLFQWLGLWLLSSFLPLLVLGLFFGGISVVFARPRWVERQIGLSFMLASATIYAFLIVAYQGSS